MKDDEQPRVVHPCYSQIMNPEETPLRSVVMPPAPLILIYAEPHQRRSITS